jgi:hypothetical protein
VIWVIWEHGLIEQVFERTFSVSGYFSAIYGSTPCKAIETSRDTSLNAFRGSVTFSSLVRLPIF